MTTYVALLRAINVGGRNKMPMAELRDLLGEFLHPKRQCGLHYFEETSVGRLLD